MQMKPRFYLLIVVLLVGLVVLLRRSPAPTQPVEPTVAMNAAPKRVTESEGRTSTEVGKSLVVESVQSKREADWHNYVRLKLEQWRTRKTGDVATEQRLAAELSALLTDANAGEMVRLLGDEYVDTPFGLLALNRWLTVDQKPALDWLRARRSLPDGVAIATAQVLVERPEVLMETCRQWPAGEERQHFISVAGLEAVPKNPLMAIELAKQMEPGKSQLNVVETAVYDWMSRDPATATAWVLKQADPAWREPLLAIGAKAIAITDPDLAANWLATAVKSEGLQLSTALTVVEIWADSDPLKASGWVQQFPAGSTREAAAEQLMKSWSRTNPAQAQSWLAQLPEGPAIKKRLDEEEAARRSSSD